MFEHLRWAVKSFFDMPAVKRPNVSSSLMLLTRNTVKLLGAVRKAELNSNELIVSLRSKERKANK